MSLTSIQNYSINKICLNKTYSQIQACKPLSDMFPIKNDVNKEMLYYHCFSTLLLEYAITKVKTNHKLLKFNGIHQVIIDADNVNLRGQNINTISFISPL